ncbi:MAG: HNH endonuclease [Candidatus Hydrogenedentota bacterium]
MRRESLDASRLACAVQRAAIRRVRDTATIRRLKALYDHHCQLCGTRLTLLDSEGYSEGHHLQPLGRGHDGPDIEANVLVLCPNCHALCDMSGLLIDFAQLRIEEEHALREKYIDYHNKLVKLAKTNRYCSTPS